MSDIFISEIHFLIQVKTHYYQYYIYVSIFGSEI